MITDFDRNKKLISSMKYYVVRQFKGKVFNNSIRLSITPYKNIPLDCNVEFFMKFDKDKLVVYKDMTGNVVIGYDTSNIEIFPDSDDATSIKIEDSIMEHLDMNTKELVNKLKADGEYDKDLAASHSFKILGKYIRGTKIFQESIDAYNDVVNSKWELKVFSKELPSIFPIIPKDTNVVPILMANFDKDKLGYYTSVFSKQRGNFKLTKLSGFLIDGKINFGIALYGIKKTIQIPYGCAELISDSKYFHFAEFH